MDKMIKIIKYNIAYYIYKEHLKYVRLEQRHSILQVSQIAIDLKANKIIKSRCTIEQIIDALLLEENND